MNVFSHLKQIVLGEIDRLSGAGDLPPDLETGAVTVEPPRDPSHGDAASNVALVLAKSARRKPREIAELVAAGLRGLSDIESVDIAGPGFINLRMTNAFWHARIADVFAAGEKYGASDIGAGQAVNVEYVSANPTGPLHIGHARGTVVGDALANLLERVGYKVTREYYINDAGAQVDTLARSAMLRYREALGEEIGDIPDGLYPGDYLVPVGKALAARDGDKWMHTEEAEWLPPVRRFTIDAMMNLIRDDLASLGVCQAVFSSERELVEAGRVDDAYDALEGRGLIYTGVLEPPKGKPPPDDWEPRPQSLFRATDFGDDTDRPLKKADGGWTYFASDIAYHRDKHERGFNIMIDVWGADHGGYVKRMKAAVKAISGGEAALDVKLCQLVKLMDGGVPVVMSKRTGQFVTLQEVVDQVGKDVVRFIMLTRKNDAPLEFDLKRVADQSKDNPVFYVQYAHARICSVLRNVAADMPDIDTAPAHLAGVDLSGLVDNAELNVIKRIAAWPRVLEGAALAHEPHRIAFYLHDLAGDFHLLWNKGKEEPAVRFIVTDDPAITAARLALLSALRVVIAAGLSVIGVKPVEEMR